MFWYMTSRMTENLVKALFYILLSLVLSLKILFFDDSTTPQSSLHRTQDAATRLEVIR